MCKTNTCPFYRVYKTSSREFKRHVQSILPTCISCGKYTLVKHSKKEGTMVLSSYFVTLIILVGVFARVPPPQRKPDVRTSTCSWRGNSYPLDREGKFRPSPCLACKCDKGRAVCRSVKCGPRTCVDAEFDPNQCCLVCPTGKGLFLKLSFFLSFLLLYCTFFYL